MTIIFMDGFDKYGDINSYNTNTLLTQGEWTTANGTFVIGGPLSATGYSLVLQGYINKTLSANYSRLIGGFRFNGRLSSNLGVVLVDTGTSQFSIGIQAGTGYVTAWSSNFGTIVFQSSVAVSALTTHYLEFDVTFAGSGTGTYSMWLDGVLIHTGNATTIQSSNSYANVVTLQAANTDQLDDFYLFSSAGSYNNAALLTNPRIQTDYPISDHQTQFTNLANVVGYPETSGSSANIYSMAAFRSIVPAVNCTLSSIHFIPSPTVATAKFLGLLYTNTGTTSIGTLLAAGSPVTGCTSNVAVTLPMSGSVSLSAGQTYWIGVLFDASNPQPYFVDSTLTSCFFINATYPTPPSSNTTFTSSTFSLSFWGTCTGATTNWESVDQNPPLTQSYYGSGTYNAIEGVTAGTEDLYGFPALPTDIAKIYAVSMKTAAKLSATGTRGISLNMYSGVTDSKGSLGTAFLSTSFVWYGSYYETDPNTATAWTRTGLAATYSGQSITV